MTAAPSLPEIKIDAHASADEARAFLERDRLMAAYALADIDQPEIEGARWWIARRDGEIAAVVMVVEGLPFRPCFATGVSDGLAAIFREASRASSSPHRRDPAVRSSCPIASSASTTCAGWS